MCVFLYFLIIKYETQKESKILKFKIKYFFFIFKRKIISNNLLKNDVNTFFFNSAKHINIINTFYDLQAKIDEIL